MRYYLKPPHARGVSFRIVCRTDSDKPIEHPTLTSINLALKQNKLNKDEARKALKELVKSLNGPTSPAIFNPDNEKILDRYWEEQYARRNLVDKASALGALKRGLRAIGNLSLASATFTQLQEQVDQLPANKQRRVVQSINQLLAYLNRDFELNKSREVKHKVKFLTESELNKMLPHLPSDAIRLLHQVSFYTGARIGEAFALEASCILPDMIRIFEQVDKQNDLRETKNRKERFAFIQKKAISIIKRWILVKGSINFRTRERMAKITKKACQAAFKDSAKHCKFHDMRHSYAIALISKGVGLTPVSQCLGNSVAVCEKYYVGYQLTSETVQMIKSIVG